MQSYQLIALDMDDTLLDSHKEISPKTQDAIHRAFAAGKEVVLCTGRSTVELSDYFQMFPEMRYAVCASGAYVYDIQNQQYLCLHPLDWELVETIFQIAEGKDVLPQIFMDSRPHFFRSQLDVSEKYHIKQYEGMFRALGVLCENPYDLCRRQHSNIVKINLYHTSAEDRQATRHMMDGLPLVFADAEVTGLELSPAGVDKGVGLQELCALLNLPLSRVISVGDSFNDIPVLKRAGLSVAVGNARTVVKEICDVIVADCDHDGVAEAIDTYLLGN